jgi:CRISPR-associated protein Cas2
MSDLGSTLTASFGKAWLKVLDLKEDCLRAYPLNETTKAQVKFYGSLPPYEPPDFLIL